ncbi:carboxypeptidase-like regulatory domain-containing protein [Hyunsoonleella sp. 2307UL5-6]|uniref:TonB-dependent receptor n=1 Tax=Hyunsoonleella sp. 2307UL5-6 TaxID=3384768 RepID=UPI0039BC7249
MKYLLLLFCSITVFSYSQNTGSVVGKLTDKEYNNEPLAFANILVKGTTKGTTSDFDGLYEIANLDPGNYTLIYSFVGYETQEIPVIIVAGKVIEVNVPMGASAAALDEIIIKAPVAQRESETALLLQQKKAVEIKESIGAQQLSRLGVSNASAATSKISGVSKSDGTGQVYVRGLGDRYLTTTLNGLPIPSDNIDKKNIDLALFPTRFVQNVSISKTFSPNNSADQASGNVNIESKIVSKNKDIGLSFTGGVNSNVGDGEIFNDFKVTANNEDLNLGVYSRAYSQDELSNAITEQGWDTRTTSLPLDYSFGFNVGGKLGESKKVNLYLSGGQSVSHEYREGEFFEYDQGNLRDSVPDNDNRRWLRTINTTGMFHSQFKINDDNRIKLNTFLVNKVVEETYEAGRQRSTIVFEELDPPSRGNQFVRDQNIKNTILSITQLIGNHRFSDKNVLDWGAGFNYVIANEPNRIRNEFNILNDDANTAENEDGIVQFGFTGGTQQRKSVQEITDQELNARLQDKIILKESEDGDDIYKLTFGGDFRNKQRDFTSQFIGVTEASRGLFTIPSLDQVSEIFTQRNFDIGALRLQELPIDTYQGELTSFAGFIDFIGVFHKFTAQLGLRYQNDEIDVNFDVGNFVNQQTGQSRIGNSLQNYERLYPSFNLKYDINDKMALRMAGSLSQTLPEFKEIAPFQYVSPENQVTQGNPDVEASKNLNIDLKFEFFPSDDELLSVTAFYKRIEDPINRGLQRGGEDIFSYFNTGNEARVIGGEIEGRIYLIKKGDSLPNLKLSGNVAYLNHTQDLKEIRDDNGNLIQTFRYGGMDEIGLEGASDWITNLALTYSSGGKYPFEITFSGNYASDRIFSLGAPRNQNQPDVFLNGEIIEQGVVTLDFILNKEINEHLSLGLSAKNLINPTVRRFQRNQSSVTGIPSKDTILTYNRGTNSSLSIRYKF